MKHKNEMQEKCYKILEVIRAGLEVDLVERPAMQKGEYLSLLDDLKIEIDMLSSFNELHNLRLAKIGKELRRNEERERWKNDPCRATRSDQVLHSAH